MPPSKKFGLIDSAFALAAISATLYFLGIANQAGDADGLGIPHAFVSRGLWETVADGATGLFASLFLIPLHLYGPDGVRWLIVFVDLAAVMGFLLIFCGVKGRRYRLHALCVWAFSVYTLTSSWPRKAK